MLSPRWSARRIFHADLMRFPRFKRRDFTLARAIGFFAIAKGAFMTFDLLLAALVALGLLVYLGLVLLRPERF
jgi:K+-transporting ATPase KdpF subunit